MFHRDSATPNARIRLAALAAALLLLAGCASAPAKPPTAEANDVLFRAIGLVGTPYRWGGNTPKTGFDCSGLVGYVYRTAAGLTLPRTSRAMSQIDAPRIQRDQLAAGDLVFFHGRGKRVDHVGIYVGNGRFVHAPNTGGEVRLDRLDAPYWRQHFLYARRPLVE
ncbi:MAG TPA: C40 family peptidase [Rhodanobacteraceae bacterium]|nr:C40 family peptidase [Rhodanobacteraceae bacterium]